MLDDISGTHGDEVPASTHIDEERDHAQRFCYCGKHYWSKAANGIWMPLTRTDAGLLLRLAGVSAKRNDYGISPLDLVFRTVITERNVGYAGMLAGTSEGVHVIEGGKRILVTESPAIVRPVAGDWPTIREVVEGLFGAQDSNDSPVNFLFGWLQIFLKSIRITMAKGTAARGGMPGQALVIAGPRDCGKSLLVAVLVEMTGGRRADPYQFMTGDTTFNGELAEAEFLVIDDQPTSKDPRARQALGSRIKEFTVMGIARIHAKFGKPVMLRPCQRLVILTNDEPENLLILPTLDPSIEDKITILRAARNAMPMATGTHAERERFWATLVSEIPAFHHFLVEEFQIQEELRSGRFGITHYHDPAIIEALGDLSAESKALGMIDHLFSRRLLRTGFVPSRAECETEDEIASVVGPESCSETWVGNARDFEAIMRNSFEMWEVGRLFQYGNSAGQLLGRLALEYPERIARHSTVRGTTRWEIRPPAKE